MIYLFVIAVVSTLFSIFAIVEPAWSDALLISIPSALAGWFLFLRLFAGKSRQASKEKWAIVDGSNVMYWRTENPEFQPLLQLVEFLIDQGRMPIVMFDANAGYLLEGRYLHNNFFEKRLRLPRGHVVVVPKGQPADPHILRAARNRDAIVVSNDRYRDWADEFSEIHTPGFLVRGGYSADNLWLSSDLEKT
ncbi:NYN domain-containing protein [Aliiroseovarius sp. 2305UL8-7]|uniref:NYN domain-containing protein n=1 Tax=Aliiroseovarius conchicola TaxID=3121637 RepID=UPI0035277BC9